MTCAAARLESALEQWLLSFFASAAAGWAWEVCLVGCATGQWVNRGVLHGPWLPVYGVGGVLFLLLGKALPQNRGLAVCLCALSGGAVEYGTALLLENWFHRKWWDYAGWTGSIQGRVCLWSVAGFAAAGWLALRLGPGLERRLARCAPGARRRVCRGLSVLFAADWTASMFWPNVGAGVAFPI